MPLRMVVTDKGLARWTESPLGRLTPSEAPSSWRQASELQVALVLIWAGAKMSPRQQWSPNEL